MDEVTCWQIRNKVFFQEVKTVRDVLDNYFSMIPTSSRRDNWVSILPEVRDRAEKEILVLISKGK